MCEHDIKRNEKHAKDYANCVKTNGIPLQSPPRERFRTVNWLLGGGSMMVMAFFAIKGVLSKTCFFQCVLIDFIKKGVSTIGKVMSSGGSSNKIFSVFIDSLAGISKISKTHCFLHFSGRLAISR